MTTERRSLPALVEDSSLPAEEKLPAIVLARATLRETGEAQIGWETLTRRTSLTIDALRRAFTSLVNRGVLVRTPQPADANGRRAATKYRLVPEKLAELKASGNGEQQATDSHGAHG